MSDLQPTDIRDLDMALRYSTIEHDYGCDVLTNRWGLGACTCPAEEFRNRAIALVKRVGAPYRKVSGDYDDDRLAATTAASDGSLDVERLARAMAAFHRREAGHVVWTITAEAQAVASEYARLRTPAPDTTETHDG
jgi:hypothetical protein